MPSDKLSEGSDKVHNHREWQKTWEMKEYLIPNNNQILFFIF